MRKLIFNKNPILHTSIINDKKENIADISYPMIISTKSREGTDSGKNGIWKGKTTIDGCIIKIGDTTCNLFRTYKTDKQFLANNYIDNIMIGQEKVFTAQEDRISSFTIYKPTITFIKNNQNYEFYNKSLIPFRYELRSNNVTIGVFENRKFLSLLPNYIFEVYDDSISDAEMIYLYAMINRHIA